jgi:hypothetical protein
MTDELSEAESLELLSGVQTELHDALNALAGKHGEGLLEHYRVHAASHINHAVDGYIYLRESRRIESSKHLIRTAIETFIRLQAICKKPELLFRIAFNEFQEDKTWVRSLPSPDTATAIQAIDSQWADFVQAYRTKYPEHTLAKEKLSLRAVAEFAGIEGYYDSHYRLYCRFTHAAFRATTGGLGDFERENNRTMTLCALAGLEALVSVGAPAPNLSALKERLTRK